MHKTNQVADMSQLEMIFLTGICLKHLSRSFVSSSDVPVPQSLNTQPNTSHLKFKLFFLTGVGGGT